MGEIIDKTRSVTVSELVAVIAGLQPGLTYNFEVPPACLSALLRCELIRI